MIDKTDPTNRDTVPAMLTPGEFVLNKEATQMYGPVIQQMNNAGLQQRAAENKAVEANMGGGIKYYNHGSTHPIEPPNREEQIQSLLNTISRGEGATPEKLAAQKGFGTTPYDMVLGYGVYGKPTKPLSEMTFREVYEYQRKLLSGQTGKVEADKQSTAVGKYQTIGTYLFGAGKSADNAIDNSWMKMAGLGPDDIYNAENQEKIGRIVLDQAGLNNYQTTGDADQFQRDLSAKWASIASPDTKDGTYGQRVDTFRSDLQPHFDSMFSPMPDNSQLASSPEVLSFVEQSNRPTTRPLGFSQEPVQVTELPNIITMDTLPKREAPPQASSFADLSQKDFLKEAGVNPNILNSNFPLRNNNISIQPDVDSAPPVMMEQPPMQPPLPTAGSNDTSFGSAFKEARGQLGAGNVFNYNGKQYTTNFAEEEDQILTANMGRKIPGYNFGDLVTGVFGGPKLDDNLLELPTESMYAPDTVPEMLLPPVNSDQSLLDGSSQSVKNSQRMMLMNNPIPNANPRPLVAPEIDNLPDPRSSMSVPDSLQDSQRMMEINNPMSVPKSVQDSQRMMEINSIPKSVQDSQRMMEINNPMSVPKSVQDSQRMMEINSVPKSVQDSQRMMEINSIIPPNKSPNMSNESQVLSEEISDLRLRMSVMPSDSEMRAILQTQVDQKLGQLETMGLSLDSNVLPKPKQTGVNTRLINAKTELETAELNMRRAMSPEDIKAAADQIAAANLKIENNLTIPVVETSLITKENTESLASRKVLLNQINDQISSSKNPKVIAALNSKKEVIQRDIKDFNNNLMLEEGGRNVFEERGRRSPYEQYGDQVQDRVNKLQASANSNETNESKLKEDDIVKKDLKEIDKIGNEVSKKDPAKVTEAKGLLSSIFGDLFDTKELARAAIMYLGARATGMSGNQALAFAGKTYLSREAASDQAHKKHLNKLIEDGTMTSASIKIYSKTEDVADLIPKGVTYTSMGETETYYNTRTGNPVQAARVKGSDGGYRWQAPNGEFLVMNRFHQDVNRSSVRPSSATNAEINDVKELFIELRDDMGTVKGASGGESAVYRTNLTPRLVGESTVGWAMKNNIPVQAVGRVLKGAYQRALADAARENKPITAQAIEGYLDDQWIQQSAGDPTDFKTDKDKPIQTTVVNGWVKNLQSKVSEVAPEAFKEMNSINFSTWLRDSDLTKKYHVTEANGGISLGDRERYIRLGNAKTPPMSGYMLFMEQQVQTEYRKLVAKRQGIS